MVNVEYPVKKNNQNNATKNFIYLTILLLDVTCEGCGRFGAQYVCSALQQHRETQLAILQQADRQDLSVPRQALHQARVGVNTTNNNSSPNTIKGISPGVIM